MTTTNTEAREIDLDELEIAVKGAPDGTCWLSDYDILRGGAQAYLALRRTPASVPDADRKRALNAICDISFHEDDPKISCDIRETIRAALMQAPSVAPEGHKLVPIEPTFDMHCAGAKALVEFDRHARVDKCDGIYKAMIAAAQPPYSEEK